MKSSRVCAVSLGILALGIAVAASCAKPVAKQESPIGVVLSLTGKGSTYGERAMNGMQVAVETLNREEPFTKRPLHLIVEDSQSNPATALSAFRKLIDADKVPVVTGMVLSDEVLTCAPVANETRTVLFSSGAGSDKIKDAGDYIFRNREPGSLQSIALAEACVQRFGFKEVAILHSNAANGISYRDGFRTEFEKIGGKVVSISAYNEGKTDFRAEIEQLRLTQPHAVYLAGMDAEMGVILRQCAEVGFKPQFFASAGAVSKKLLESAGEAAEGMVCVTAAFDAESKKPKVAAFVNAFQTKYGKEPDWVAATSFDAICILASLIRNGAENSEQIKTELYGIRDFEGISGTTSFDKDGEVTKPALLVKVQRGKFVPLD